MDFFLQTVANYLTRLSAQKFISWLHISLSAIHHLWYKNRGALGREANATIIQYWWCTTLFVLTLNMTHFKHFFIGQYLRSNYKELLVSVPQLYKKCTHTTFWTNFELKDVFQVNCCIKLHFDNWAGAAAGNKHPTCCQTILCCWNCISRKLDILSDLCQKVKISRTNHQA